MTLASRWQDMEWAEDECVASDLPTQQEEVRVADPQEDGEAEVSDGSRIMVKPHEVLFRHNSNDLLSKQFGSSLILLCNP